MTIEEIIKTINFGLYGFVGLLVFGIILLLLKIVIGIVLAIKKRKDK